MTQQSSMACDNLIDYLVDELSDRERIAFENHARSCPNCEAELNAVLPVHTQLLEDDVDIPSDEWFSEHKERLLSPVFSTHCPKSAGTNNIRLQRVIAVVRRAQQRIKWSSAIAILMIVLGLGFGISGSGDGTSPARFVQKVALQPNKVYPDAHGVALVVNNHDKVNLILYVSNVPEQSQWGCYDVWGVQGGIRYSLGEFTVDHNGTGALSVNLPTDRKYDSMEVTLEPNWGDKQPRGPQVLVGPWTNV